jgi:tRNA threonylcarbamoyladenosine biosynthesis protein TsaE
MIIEAHSEDEMKAFGARLARLFTGGEVIELVGDVGSGKTTLTKGIAKGLGVDEDVQSPSFTISRVYDARDGLRLAHYDFYRLGEAGLMADDLNEAMHDKHTVTVIEWAGIVESTLPVDRLTLNFVSPSETSRRLIVEAHGPRSVMIERAL